MTDLKVKDSANNVNKTQDGETSSSGLKLRLLPMGILTAPSFLSKCREAKHFLLFVYLEIPSVLFSTICFSSSFLCPLFCSSHPPQVMTVQMFASRAEKQSQKTIKRIKLSMASFFFFSKHGYFSFKSCELWRTHGMHVCLCCPGPERFLCRPLRSKTEKLTDMISLKEENRDSRN